jgi:hypothetical protein
MFPNDNADRSVLVSTARLHFIIFIFCFHDAMVMSQINRRCRNLYDHMRMLEVPGRRFRPGELGSRLNSGAAPATVAERKSRWETTGSQ